MSGLAPRPRPLVRACVFVSSLLGASSAASADGIPLNARYDRGVVLATDEGDFQLRLSLRSQFRFELTRPADGDAESEASFYIPRARLQLEGNVFGPETRYKLELALGDRGSYSFVRDLYIDRRLGPTGPWLRFGQWKRPFNRQELVGDFTSELNERAITAAFAGGGRDLGVAVHNDYERSPDGLEWAVGVFNSFDGGADRPIIGATCVEELMELDCETAPPTTVPADFGPAIVARVGWNTGGIKGYSEGDLEGGPARLAVGAAYKVDLADLTDEPSHGVELDALLKVHGFDLQGGVYLMKLQAADAELAAHVQAGYFVVPARAQVAARAAVMPIDDDRLLIEARGAFSWLWEGHRWKWTTDAGALIPTGTDPVTMTSAPADLQLRSMAQLSF